jgi:nucleoside-diphosphate-sugar epimerase
MPETVLVTGGTGFVAGWCIVELLRRDYEVRTTIRSREKEAHLRSAVAAGAGDDDRLSCFVADLTADDGWDDAMRGCNYVLHVASPLGTANAEDADALVVPARDGALRVLRAAATADVRRVVMTSAANTASPTSYTEDSVTDEQLWTDPDAPDLGAYRRSKTLAELAAWAYMQETQPSTTLATVLPGAVFGPILSLDNLGSVQVIGRMLSGAMPGTPQIGLEVVDVRDVVDLHLRAMTSPAAAGQRFLGTGEFMWMSEIADVLRAHLGSQADKVPTETLPNSFVRELAESSAELRGILPGLGRRNRHTTAKAEQMLGWVRRPTTDTIVECARSLIEQGAVP